MSNISTLGFNGEYLGDTLDNYHLGNGYRAYNPTTMQFTAPDDMSPFGHGGINPYVYCSGDPINNTDPTGHMFLMPALISVAEDLSPVSIPNEIALLPMAESLGETAFNMLMVIGTEGLSIPVLNTVKSALVTTSEKTIESALVTTSEKTIEKKVANTTEKTITKEVQSYVDDGAPGSSKMRIKKRPYPNETINQATVQHAPAKIKKATNTFTNQEWDGPILSSEVRVNQALANARRNPLGGLRYLRYNTAEVWAPTAEDQYDIIGHTNHTYSTILKSLENGSWQQVDLAGNITAFLRNYRP